MYHLLLTPVAAREPYFLKSVFQIFEMSNFFKLHVVQTKLLDCQSLAHKWVFESPSGVAQEERTESKGG